MYAAALRYFDEDQLMSRYEREIKCWIVVAFLFALLIGADAMMNAATGGHGLQCDPAWAEQCSSDR
jgi:hypothetical protein